MASNPPSGQSGQSGGGLTNAIKGIFGNTALGGAPKSTMPAPIKIKAPHDRDTLPELPELVNTPSEVGIWESSAHDLKSENGRFQWSRLFQDPRTYRTDLAPPSPAASPKK